MSEEEKEPKPAKKRTRRVVPYPLCPFEEVVDFAQSLYELGSGHRVRRVTLFDHIGKSPDSGPSRALITNSNKYGLVKGGYQAEQLELTPLGLNAFSESSSEYEKAQAKIQLAILDISPLKILFEKFSGNKMPVKTVLSDTLRENEIEEDVIDTLVDIFVVNAEHVGILQTLAGAGRIVTIDHALENLSKSHSALPAMHGTAPVEAKRKDITGFVTSGNSTFDSTCFYITPIGEDGTENRKHSDLFIGSIIEPAIEQLGLKVVRADAIDQPGLITNQIIEYILRSRLVVADLSFNNPNVFYELALRHVSRLPTIQTIRKGDKIPFDIGNFRTIILDCTDIYTLVPKLETYKSEIAAQARRVLEDPDSIENPVTSVYPSLNLDLQK
ncbi:hypothetical protein [Pseudomonas sp. OIL-1]|uniref:hypothetical protein n=1 Tax=Pseudomonas sp. OIL-1 TaxID=2706126 RepID=UPI0013A78DCE|nr:hypothetical protein [Pseudomonas sp. OIL-1]QIB50929.1 hypothetical protein G3M63_07615 [Pseudomonas sp. OIL-1]